MNIRNFFDTYFNPLCHSKCKEEIKSSIDAVSQQFNALLNEYKLSQQKDNDHLKHKIGLFKRDLEIKISKVSRSCEDSKKPLQKTIETAS